MTADLNRPPKSLKRAFLEALRHVDNAEHQRFLLAVGAVFTGADGAGHVSQKQVAEYLHKGERTVRRYFDWAKGEGWLVQTARGHRRGNGVLIASSYRLSLPATLDDRLTTDVYRPDDESLPAKSATSTGHPGWPPNSPSNSPSNSSRSTKAVEHLQEMWGCSEAAAREIYERNTLGRTVASPLAYVKAGIERTPERWQPAPESQPDTSRGYDANCKWQCDRGFLYTFEGGAEKVVHCQCRQEAAS